MTNAQCAHVWAQQEKPEGRSKNGHLYFNGRTIYSYGSHYPIARFTDKRLNGQQVVLFNSVGSTMTTESKHKGPVRQALYGLPVRVFCVPRPTALGDSEHWRNVEHFVTVVNESLLSAGRSRKYAEMHIEAAQRASTDAYEYAQVFGCPRPMLPEITAETIAAAKAQAARVAKEEAAQRKAREAQRAALAVIEVDEWRAGQRSALNCDAR